MFKNEHKFHKTVCYPPNFNLKDSSELHSSSCGDRQQRLTGKLFKDFHTKETSLHFFKKCYFVVHTFHYGCFLYTPQILLSPHLLLLFFLQIMQCNKMTTALSFQRHNGGKFRSTLILLKPVVHHNIPKHEVVNIHMDFGE